MYESEKLCLKWNDFQTNVNSAFGMLRNDQDLCDVTLVCEDGKQFEAHKVVLASSSPFFLELLKRNKHPHPLVFMRGVKADDLSSLVDFLYYGEANVLQESLDTFLALAEDLKLKGLTGTSENESNIGTNMKAPKNNPSHHNNKTKYQQNIPDQTKTIQSNTKIERDVSPEMVVAVVNQASHPELQQLDEQIKSMMEFSGNMVTVGKETSKGSICKVCGKEGKSIDVKRHIEVNHITGVTHSCDICGKNSRSRDGLRQHKTNHHSQSIPSF